MDLEPKSSLFLPIYGEARSTRNNIPTVSTLTLGVRCINLISADGQFIEHREHIHNALKQPSSFEYIALKNCLKITVRHIPRCQFQLIKRREPIEHLWEDIV